MSHNDEHRRSAIGAVAGFIFGAYIGSSLGIAGYGTAMSGTIPVGLLGLWLGYLYGDRIVSIIQGKEGNTNHSINNSKTAWPPHRSNEYKSPVTSSRQLPDRFWKLFMMFSIGIFVLYAVVSRSITIFGVFIVLVLAFFCAKIFHQSDFIDREKQSEQNPSEGTETQEKASDRVVGGFPRGDGCCVDMHSPDDGILRSNESKNEVIVSLIGRQICRAYADVDLSEIDDEHEDDWSIAYVFGFKDVFIQWNGESHDADRSIDVTATFVALYGSQKGPELCSRAFRLQGEHHMLVSGAGRVFADGLATGEQDAMDWLTSQGDKIPLRWFKYLNRQLQDI